MSSHYTISPGISFLHLVIREYVWKQSLWPWYLKVKGFLPVLLIGHVPVTSTKFAICFLLRDTLFIRSFRNQVPGFSHCIFSHSGSHLEHMLPYKSFQESLLSSICCCLGAKSRWYYPWMLSFCLFEKFPFLPWVDQMSPYASQVNVTWYLEYTSPTATRYTKDVSV